VGNSYIIAIDQSTSATKAILFDRSALPVHRVTIEHQQYYPKPGWVEHDPTEIVENTIAAIGGLVQESGVDAAAIAALAITNQRETIVAWDAESRRPLYRAIVWQDERGLPYCRAADERMGSEMIREKTGLIVDSYFSASKLQWLIENEVGVRDAARAGRLLCGTIDAWLIWNLTEGREFATDYSNACRTLLFDIKRLRWDEELITLFGLEGARFPEPRPSDADFGRATRDGLPTSLPIIGVMGDSHASLFGQGGFERGGAKASYGTGSSIMMNVGNEAAVPPKGVVLSIGWGLGSTVSYVLEANVHSSGDTLKWVRDNLGLFRDYGEAEELARSLPDNGGVYLVPAFSGLGAPHWVHGVRGIITGLSRGSGKGEIIRAALECIAYQVTDVIDVVASSRGLSIPLLRVDGAPSSNEFLMQFQADLLDADIGVAPIEEISARGVAFAAGLRKGLWGATSELNELASFRRIYHPEMTGPKREVLLAEWHRAVDQVLSAKQAEGSS